MSTLLKQAQPTFGELCGNGKTYEAPPSKEIIAGTKKIGKTFGLIFWH